MVYLNRSYLLADDLERMQRGWVARNPGVRRGRLVPAPYSRIDGITAHELWHRIENAHHQTDWIAIHRALGVELGVETLEQALRGGAKTRAAGVAARVRARRRRSVAVRDHEPARGQGGDVHAVVVPRRSPRHHSSRASVR